MVQRLVYSMLLALARVPTVLCSVKLANERHDQLLIIARGLQRLECVPLSMALSIVCCRPPESKPKVVDMDKQNLGT